MKGLDRVAEGDGSLPNDSARKPLYTPYVAAGQDPERGSPGGSPRRPVFTDLPDGSERGQSRVDSPARSRRSARSVHSVASHAASTTLQAEWKGMGKATLFSCTANLTNSVVGAGILGLPHAVAQMGYVLGIATMVVFCLLSMFSLHLLAQCAYHFVRQGQPSSFYAVAVKAVPRWCLLTDFGVLINCFGNGATYLIVIADQMPKVMDFLGAGSTAQNRRIWVLIAFCIVAPLSSLPRLDMLRFTSTASMVFIAFVTVMIVLYAIPDDGLDPCHEVAPGDRCTGETVLLNKDTEALKALTVFIFCFVCHQNIFSVCNEMERPSPRRYDASLCSAQAGALFVYITVAAASYYTYGHLVDSDMLKSYPVVTIVSIARLCIALLVAFAYPLQAHPARKSAVSMWEQLARRGEESADAECEGEAKKACERPDEHDENQDGEEVRILNADDAQSVGTVTEDTKLVRYWTVTVSFLGATVAVALAVSDLGSALAVVGGTASTLVCYIVPGICYYNIFTEPHLKRTLAFALFCLGCVIVPASLAITFAA